ncbi:hypothetical protein [Rhizobium sp. ZPR3]|uniref:Uncharacterized protein n=2 Tax=unclassified Rhizobium TaxID=2613769 RepID=A0AAU7SQK9_9HYPH
MAVERNDDTDGFLSIHPGRNGTPNKAAVQKSGYRCQYREGSDEGEFLKPLGSGFRRVSTRPYHAASPDLQKGMSGSNPLISPKPCSAGAAYRQRRGFY